MPLAELAPKFGLAFAVNIDRLISKAQAVAIAKRILHCDLAYSSEIMTKIAANALASRFLECFTEEDSQYYTNGNYYSTAPRSGWMPAAAATFDTGIVVIGKSRTGCLWVEEED
ncbi:hypothetical protein C7B82_16420 [Stenomitos frigidus ULC18]|uniref:Uncharacterized protein n=2 Tax=Stenomitos TaxID=1844270 RepID=A0A2T1E455_9CYAN|nr:hypothetical protein C7B82_16420 [Stenomitos frigidus ULC18]